MTKKELANKMREYLLGLSVHDGDKNEWWGTPRATASGTVLELADMLKIERDSIILESELETVGNWKDAR